MIDCNVTENYFKEQKRMCRSMNINCKGCAIAEENKQGVICLTFCRENPDKAIEIVQKWSDEHPLKTGLTEFLAKYPDADLDEYGYPTLCIHRLDGTWNRDCNKPVNCEECMRKFWNEPIMEEKNEQLKFSGATLLSGEEARTLLTKEERKYKSWWWLRSPGSNCNFACSVDYYGNVYYYNFVNCAGRDVRPALQISNLSETDFKVGNCFNLNGYNFKIISESLAFMIDSDIGKRRFDEKNNDYEKSEIKKFVDEWFQNFIKS